MNLLPKSKEEFGQKEYWDSFFKKRGKQAFEWYGEYPELAGHLHKYIKKQDNVLITGCGNSTVGRDLYDIGYSKITNIDISQVVIRQMLSQHEKDRPQLQYIQMDVTRMEFENEEFNVVFDKGTLDALMPNDKEETLVKIKQYFGEIQRVLKTGGRFICVSLLQEHILKFILEYFPSNDFIFRALRCFEIEQKAIENGENTMPVFMVVCTKFKMLPRKVLELNLGSSEKLQRYEQEDEIVMHILSMQHAAFVCSGLRQSSIADESEVVLDLYELGGTSPRFTVYVVDVPRKKHYAEYAGFIVPEGREAEWLFSTKAGRKNLVNVTKHNRLAIITLHRGQRYDSFEAVQKELTDTICSLAPSSLSSRKIPFLSLGSDVGHRTVKYEGHSEYSGDFIIEDVETENGEKYRRLFYLKSQLVIQSEAKLRTIKSRKGVVKEIVDLTYLNCRHHVYMTIAAHMSCKDKEKKKCNITVIGLGGGGLCSFLHKFLPKVNILGVDIDKEMLTVAREWFEFQQNEKLKATIQDGIEYLKETAQNDEKIDALLFDMDNKDSSVGLSCPPKQFLEKEVLENCSQIISNDGLFVVNLVLRDQSLKPNIIKNLENNFQSVISYKLQEDLNEIFICSNKQISLEHLKEATVELNKFFKKHNTVDNGIDIEKFMETLNIHSSSIKS